ncbi:MAG: TonB-dependent receptor [Opitutus sp.]|nr:TonB-dependent receptor [Opitutus sp.]
MSTSRVSTGRTFCLGLLAASSTLAQVTVPPSPNRVEVDAIVDLSPFVVRSERDTGYQAATTLAGTRVNTPIKDLAAAISVYTKDFIDDLGATSSSDLLVFATGMEAAGASGNFADIGADVNNERPSANGARHEPQAASRSRGLSSPTYTRGYFATSIAFDTYNTGAVTVNRGPNAALFGVGSPAGVVDTALALAELRENRSSLSFRYGNNDSLRRSVDLNRVLIPQKLALRIALLHDREKFNQRPAFEEKRRGYGATTVRPFPSTTVRANFEAGRTSANRPIAFTPYNSASSYWFQAGRPGYDWRFYDDPVLNPNTANHGSATEGFLQANNQAGSQPIIVYSNPDDRSPSFGFMGSLASTAANLGNAVKNQVLNPVFNRNGLSDSIRFLHTSNVWEIPAAFWTAANVKPGQLPGFVPAGVKAQGFTDYSAFDYAGRMLDETSRQSDSFRTLNVTLEQDFWSNHAGLQLAFDRQRIDRRSKNSFFSQGNSNHIYVDTSVTLPNGLTNPNLGRPFAVYGQSNWLEKFEEREGRRATGFLKYDFKELRSGRAGWLGRHTLTGFYEENAVNQINYRVPTTVQGEAAEQFSNTALNTIGRRPALLVYLGPSVIGNNNSLRLEAIRIGDVTPGPTANISYFQREADATDPGRTKVAPARLDEIAGPGSASREVIKSQAAVLQSYWLREALITTLSWRRDEDFFVSEPISYRANPRDPNDPGQSRFGLKDFSFFGGTPPPFAAKEIKSYGAVLRWPTAWLRTRLPAGLDVSAFVNRSENFTPLGGRINAFGEPWPSPSGKTKEYGFNLSGWQDKFTLRVNWFETSIVGASSSPTSLTITTVNSILQTAAGWAVEANTSPQVAALRAQHLNLLFGALPSNYRDLYQFRVTGTAPNLAVSGNTSSGLSGSTDTRDFVAKGTELDLVFNPTSRWRILANVARQETVQSNSYPFTRRFVQTMKPAWDQLGNVPRGNYPNGFQPGQTLPANTQTYAQWLDINVYVPLSTALATDGSVSAEQRKWRANLITNYAFGSDSLFGPALKGFAIGGGVRWQDKVGIGYPASRNPDGSVTIDVAHPYYAPADTSVDAWIGYERPIWQKRIRWKVQLNGRNLLAERDLIPVTVQPWGEVATARIPPERRWYLTNTFSF